MLQYVENKVPLALKRSVAAYRFLNKICFNEGYLSGPKVRRSNLETPCIIMDPTLVLVSFLICFCPIFFFLKKYEYVRSQNNDITIYKNWALYVKHCKITFLASTVNIKYKFLTLITRIIVEVPEKSEVVPFHDTCHSHEPKEKFLCINL